MATGVVAACLVLAAFGLALLVVRRSRLQAERRIEAVMEQVSRHLDAVAAGVEESVARIAGVQRERLQPLTLDFDVLVEDIAAEAAARTGADAAVLRIEGPGGRPVLASAGSSVDGELLEQTLSASDSRALRAATIDWTHSPVGEPDDEQFHSALVVPLGPRAGVPGTLVAYALPPQAFRPEHTEALQELLDEVAVGLANARRFAEVEARLLLDPETGVTNRRGYELELGREVARASRSGRPLSVVLVGVPNGPETTTTTGVSRNVDQFARILTRVTRRSDISCRRGERQFAILLPETRESGATVLTSRLREEAKRSLGRAAETIAVGHVEWQRDESPEALEARVEATLAGTSSPPTLVSALPERPRPDEMRAVEAHAAPATDALRRDVLEAVAREILAGGPPGRSLAVAALDVDGLDELSERDREAADAVLGTVAERLSDSVGSGSVHRIGASEFVLVLSGASAHDAEALLGSLHVPAEEGDDPGVTLSAGITEVVERDGAQTAVARAEHALWQAKQAGRGTVVVAVPGRLTTRFE